MLIPRSLWIPACLACSLFIACGANAAEKKKLLMKPIYDPEAPKIGLFEALEQELITVKMVAKNSEGGALLVENHTDQPLSVEMPEAIVGVQVLPQFGGGLGGQQGGLGGQQGGLGGQQGGQNQSIGGGGQQGGLGGGGGLGQQGGGGGFFSVPPDRIARVPYRSVRLEHGKADPNPHVYYRIVRPEEYSADPKLHQLLKLVASGQLDQQSAQAAAWNIANGMSWEQLANKTFNHVNAPDSPYFNRNTLLNAQRIVAEAERLAKVAAEQGEQPVQPKVKSRVPTSAN